MRSKSPAEAYRDLLLIAVTTRAIVVELGTGFRPMYYSRNRSGRRDKKARITMPGAGGYALFDQTATTDKIDKALSGKNSENHLLLFSHELGHHLTHNPKYDDALKCIGKPIRQRKVDEMLLIVKEEAEAWAFGYRSLRSVGYDIPKKLRRRASLRIYGYCKGLVCRDVPKNPILKHSKLRNLISKLLFLWGMGCAFRIRIKIAPYAVCGKNR